MLCSNRTSAPPDFAERCERDVLSCATQRPFPYCPLSRAAFSPPNLECSVSSGAQCVDAADDYKICTVESDLGGSPTNAVGFCQNGACFSRSDLCPFERLCNATSGVALPPGAQLAPHEQRAECDINANCVVKNVNCFSSPQQSECFQDGFRGRCIVNRQCELVRLRLLARRKC